MGYSVHICEYMSTHSVHSMEGGGGPHVAHNTATAFTSVHQVSSSIRGALSM